MELARHNLADVVGHASLDLAKYIDQKSNVRSPRLLHQYENCKCV